MARRALVAAWGLEAVRRIPGGVKRLSTDIDGQLFSGGPMLAVATKGVEAARLDGGVYLLSGRLDNRAEIAAQLRLPPAASGAELVRKGWTLWGEGLAARLRGDFVVLAWDEARREGVLARDHLGLRPLVMIERDGGLIFAHEPRDLLAVLRTTPGPDAHVVAHMLASRPYHSSLTPYAGLRRVDPAHQILLSGDGWRISRYWQPVYAGTLQGPREAMAPVLRPVVQRAVEQRREARSGVLMSGGLDSTLVAGIAHAPPAAEARAYSSFYPEWPDADESAWIRLAADGMGIASVAHITPGSGMLLSALQHASQWRLPLVGWGWPWMRPLLTAAKEDGCETILLGDGGDELFGSRFYMLADLMRRGRPDLAVRAARRLPESGVGPPPRPLLANLLLRYGVAGALPWRARRLATIVARNEESPPAWMAAGCRRLLDARDDTAWKRLDGPRWWASLANVMTHGMQALGPLDQSRRMGEEAGIDVRHPLLDVELVELALRLPPEHCLDDVYTRPVQRDLMRGIVPDQVRLRLDKTVFSSLLATVFQRDEWPGMHRLLADRGARIRAYTDPHILERDILNGPTGRAGNDVWAWALGVWRLTSIECWLRAIEDRSEVEALEEMLPVARPAGPIVR
jgi:asparagine synthase (glutamine-hydrolysing)